jgi:uncharacterized membrane protein
MRWLLDFLVPGSGDNSAAASGNAWLAWLGWILAGLLLLLLLLILFTRRRRKEPVRAAA